MVVLVVAVVVVLILVLSAVVLGLLPGGSGSSSGAGSSPPFSSARGVADAFATDHGTWDLIEAVGVADQNGSLLPYNGSENANCTTTPLVGSLPTTLTLPAFQGSLTSGDAPIWLFVYIAPATGSLLAVFEASGQVELAFEGSSGCLGTSLSDIQGIPSTVVDSPAAVSAAAAAGGASFLGEHPTGVTLTMVLTGGVTFLNGVNGTFWEISWSTCGSGLVGGSSAPTSGYDFVATVNATSGVVVPKSPTNGTCGVPSGPQGIGAALTVGPPTLYQGPGTGGTIASQGCTSGDYCYSIPLEETAMNVTPAEFEMSVSNETDGQTFPGTVGFAILTTTGAVLVSSTGAVEDQWTPGVGSSTTLLTAGMTVTVDLGPSVPTGENLAVDFTGEGPFVGSVLGVGLAP